MSAFVGEAAESRDHVEFKPRKRKNRARQPLDCRNIGCGNSTAMHAGIKINLHFQGYIGSRSRTRETSGRRFVVAVHRYPNVTCGHFRDAPPLRLAKNRIGNADILNTRRGERLGFAGLCADDSSRPRSHLRACDLRHFVGFHMWTKFYSARSNRCLPLANVRFHAVKVNEQGRGIEVGDAVAGLGTFIYWTGCRRFRYASRHTAPAEEGLLKRINSGMSTDYNAAHASPSAALFFCRFRLRAAEI